MISIGSHISASGGYKEMAEDAIALGADTFAFFTRNPRGGKAKAIIESDVQACLALAKEHSFGKIVAHAPYTMNPCAAREDLREFAKEIMLDDLRRMELMPGNYYNFHPGNHVGQGVEEGVRLTASMLNSVLSPEQSTIVLIETIAGKGTEIGGTFENIRAIIDGVELSDKVGVCLDTCHVWDSGYDLVGDLDGVVREFDSVIGLDRLKAIHLNDSMNPLGYCKDRHQLIGKGYIGEDAMKRIVTHPAFQGLPFILETPNDYPGWKEEIAMVRSWF